MPRAALVAAPIALFVTAPAVGLGVLSAEPTVGEPALTPATTLRAAVDPSDLDRSDVSRSGRRGGSTQAEERGADVVFQAQQQYAAQQARAATARAVKRADTALWTTTDLNLWTAAGKGADKIGALEEGEKILVTGRRDAGRIEIVVDGKARWVTQGYLSDEKPIEGIGGVCTNGSAVSSGVGPNVAKVHTAVCAAFPSITSYGTLRGGGGDHPRGRAVDIMVSGALGWDVADFVRANAGALGVSYVIYAQRIWSVERGGEGWRGMSNRGSATANHFDHVHVSTY